MIPQEKTEAVFRALHQAFGTTAIEDTRRMTKGLSSDLVYRIVIRGAPFLLRIMTRIDQHNDPARIFSYMKTTAEAGLSPRVLYIDTQEGIAIIDFIETVDFPPSRALALLPRTLRKLHALPPFSKTFDYVTAHQYFIGKFRAGGLVPADEIDEVFRRYAEIRAVYPRVDADLVSCHLDLKPENILFDGIRVWLVDWMAAALNDRYFDLAIIANFLVTNDAEEWLLLEEYFGYPADKYMRSRFFLMRQVAHVFAAAIFLMLGAAGQSLRPSEDLPSFRGFHDRIWAGEIDLADNHLKIVYGRVHWRQLLENVRHPRFDQALRSVEERNAGQMRLLLPSAP